MFNFITSNTNRIPMTENPAPAVRFLSIRLSEDEYKEVYGHLQQSACRSLTEYVKKVLTNKPVTVKIRDQSREDLLQQLVLIKTRLETLIDKGQNGQSLQNEIIDIKQSIREIADKCSQ
jgi:hypothetical protein